MGYRIYNAEGEHIGGDEKLDEVTRAAALLVNGWVTDDEGEVVYNSPRREEQIAQEDSERES